MSIAVIGAGAFGTALANVFASDGTEVQLWARDAAQVVAINRERCNHTRLPGQPLAPSLRATDNLARLSNAQTCLIALPAQKTAAFLAENHQILPKCPLIFCAKGINKDDFSLQSDHAPKDQPWAVLSGPGFAIEIAQLLPTALVLAAPDPLGIELQSLLARPSLRLYRSQDTTGVQLGGALKNVIAIAAGIAIGAGYGEGARAALITRGFAEMRRLAIACGAQSDTLTGLSGLGDLALTCGSDKSRNFRQGLALGSNRTTDAQTVEGIATAAAVVKLAQTKNIDLPVCAGVADILSRRRTIPDTITDLMSRPLTTET